jgi:N-acetylmuramoyl-L-alanine amidase
MPGIVGESLYVTNSTEANLLKQERVQRAIASAYMRGLEAYFTEFPN